MSETSQSKFKENLIYLELTLLVILGLVFLICLFTDFLLVEYEPGAFVAHVDDILTRWKFFAPFMAAVLTTPIFLLPFLALLVCLGIHVYMVTQPKRRSVDELAENIDRVADHIRRNRKRT